MLWQVVIDDANTHKIADVIARITAAAFHDIPDRDIDVDGLERIQGVPDGTAVGNPRITLYPIANGDRMIVGIIGIDVRIAVTWRGQAGHQGRRARAASPA